MSAAERLDPSRPGPSPPSSPPPPSALPIAGAGPGNDAANDNRDAVPFAGLAAGPGIPVRAGASPVRWPRVFP